MCDGSSGSLHVPIVHKMKRRYDLDQTFTHRTDTHAFNIRWTRLGQKRIGAPVLVFVHGTPWSSIVWEDLAACLSSRYIIYLYDHPGFGESPSPTRLKETDRQDEIDLDGALTLRAEASAALFAHWGVQSEPVHVVSHDNGGLVSLRLFLQHDIRFRSLCLVDVVAIGPFGLPFFKVVAENESVFTAVPPHLVDGFVRSYVRHATFRNMSAETEDMLVAPWLPDGTQGPARFFQEMVQAHHRDTDDIEHQYIRLGDRLSVKIIWGEDDAWLPVEIAHRLKDVLGTTEEVTLIPEAGHLIQVDQPSRLALEVGLWLERNREARM